MEVTRGLIVAAADPGDYSRKPRPFLVVQADAFNATHPSVSMCPITSELTMQSLVRVPVQPTSENGLESASEIQIDKVQSLRRERIRSTIGELDEANMAVVGDALRRWFDL